VSEGEDEGFIGRYGVVFRKTGSKFEDSRSHAYMEWSKKSGGFFVEAVFVPVITFTGEAWSRR